MKNQDKRATKSHLKQTASMPVIFTVEKISCRKRITIEGLCGYLKYTPLIKRNIGKVSIRSSRDPVLIVRVPALAMRHKLFTPGLTRITVTETVIGKFSEKYEVGEILEVMVSETGERQITMQLFELLHLS